MKKVLLSAIACSSMPFYASDDAIRQQKQENDLRFIQEKVASGCIAIKPLIGGLTSARLYELISKDDEPCVIRFLGGFSQKQKHKESEIVVMHTAASASVGPAIFKADAQEGGNSYIVMQKINYMPPDEMPWSKEDTYIKLGLFLRNMHNQASEILIDEHRSTYKRIGMLTALITNRYMKSDRARLSHCEEFCNLCNLLSQLNIHMADAQKVLMPQSRTILVHGDLHPGNLLFSKDNNGTLQDIIAIDWDQSRFHTDPYFDAALVYDFYVPKEFRECFMRAYAETPKLPAKQDAHFQVMRTVASCFFGLAYACANPTYFAQKITAPQEAPALKLGAAIRKIMHGGFKRGTKQECETFGTLLFQKGYKPITTGKFSSCIKILSNK